MTNTEFYKYHGTGNDFVIIDNRHLQFSKNPGEIAALCHRRFGVGADGLILLEKDDRTDFKMVYYNADGQESTMCGNGGRCLVAFAHHLGLFADKTVFTAIDGDHEAQLHGDKVKLKMSDVSSLSEFESYHTLDTGSPHYVQFVSDLQDYDVFGHGNKIRNSPTYCSEGINVNFVERLNADSIYVRTYERGVEDETYSCGTGATAAALVLMKENDLQAVKVRVLGGELRVEAEKNGEGFNNIWLEGPATFVFKGNTKV